MPLQVVAVQVAQGLPVDVVVREGPGVLLQPEPAQPGSNVHGGPPPPPYRSIALKSRRRLPADLRTREEAYR